jgi:hypothetical protein
MWIRFTEALTLGHWLLRVNATPHLRIFVHTLSSAEAVHHQSGMVNPSTKHRKGTSALFPHGRHSCFTRASRICTVWGIWPCIAWTASAVTVMK